MPSLFIDDDYEYRIGFKATEGRAALEFNLRPFAAADGARRYHLCLLAENATELVLSDMLGEGGQPPRVTSWNLKRECNRQNLQKLRGPEFETIMLAMYDKIRPDYEVVDGEPRQWTLTEEREKNSGGAST